MNYKMMKVFDCHKMPANIKKEFFNMTDDVGNDCCVEWFWPGEALNVNMWLLQNGCEEEERILITHWW